MTGPTPSLSVVIPVYNEIGKLERNLRHCVAYLSGQSDRFEILAVDDFSTDGSWELLEQLRESGLPIRTSRHPRNLGKGMALRNGLGLSSGEWVVLIDADSELPIEMLSSFRRIQVSTGADLVVGSKRHPHSRIHYPLRRRFLSRGYNLIVRWIFDLPVTDTQVGFKLIRGDLARRLSRSSLVKRFAIDVEFLVQASLLSANLVDAPVELKFSRKGSGRVTVRTVLEISRETAGIWYRRYISGFYARALCGYGKI